MVRQPLHKKEQIHFDKQSFFIGMLYLKIVDNLEEKNTYIGIKFESWNNCQNPRINFMFNELYSKYV